MRAEHRTARLLAWAAIAAQIAFVLAWIVGGALEDGYSHLRHHISELGAEGAANPLLVNAAFVLLGLSVAGLAAALVLVVPRRPALWAAAALLTLSGLALVVLGVFHLDCSTALSPRCEGLWESGRASTEFEVHAWAGLAFPLLYVLTPFAVARALWPGYDGMAAYVCGVIGLALGAAAFLLGGEGEGGGLAQRAGMLLVHEWALILAVGVLYATRRPPEPGPLVPLRPRDFFAQEWEGEGELVLWPYPLGRLVRQRFEASRRSTFVSDRVWLMDDELRFGHGRRLRRHMFLELEGDDRVRVTAGDLPEGAGVLLEEGGYRVVPFRMNFPVGPVPVAIHCHDRSYVEEDGTFVNVTEARALGLGIPLAKTTFRVRPLEAPPGDQASALSAAGA